MILTVIFLITCIITARVLEKKKMRAASIAYSVLFVIFLVALLFVTDLKPLQTALINTVGVKIYFSVRFSLLEAINATGYGMIIAGAILFTIALQLFATVVCVVDKLVEIFKKSSFQYKSRRDIFKRILFTHEVFLAKRINLLYCRMLN